MYESATVTGDAERTAFRKAEKKYKLYKNPPKSRERFRSVDLTKVIDFKSILDSLNRDGIIPQGIYEFRCDFDRPVFCFDSHPGFYFIPGALSLNQQCRWIRESLMYFPQPPNRTNHNVIYGPIPDLFLASQHQKFFMKLDPPTGNDKMESSTNGCSTTWQWLSSEECANMSKMNSCKAVPASVLLRKLRWSTIGLQFDWSKRNYDLSLPHNKIPDDLCQLAKNMARPAMPIGEIFHPEAAIVNYFGSDDTLGGHLDDMEADWSKPIVSISLGCKGIFLLGGKTREVPPIAMFLRSGDVVLMAGQARECFHGVPRIFVDPENSEVSELASQLSHPDDSCLLQYIKTSRININIRQVH